MKVLFQNRANVMELRGGDTVQMLETKQQLEQLGVTVDISLEAEPDLNGYDLVHIFNIQTADYGIRQIINARKQGVPIALSTIYWDFRPVFKYKNRFLYHNSPLIRNLAKINVNIPYLIRQVSHLFRDKNKDNNIIKMLQEADILLPNSHAELEILAQQFDLPEVRGKAIVVPNGVKALEAKEYLGQSELITNSLPEEYVLQVGRLEFLKGQLELVKALYNNPEIPLVFVGRFWEPHYVSECQRIGEKRGNTFFINEIPHDQVYGLYKKAKVHVLPSLRESPGLTTLEAASCGVNCVVSIYGPVAEYFGFDAYCCDPLNPESLRNAVLKAWQSPRNDNLKNKVLQEFTWQRAAKETLKAYNHLLKK